MKARFKEPVTITVKTDIQRQYARAASLLADRKENLCLVRRNDPPFFVLWAELVNDELRRWLSSRDHQKGRYLLLAEDLSSDSFVKRVLDLNIRRWDRLYALNCEKGEMGPALRQVLFRLFVYLQDETRSRILDAKIEGNDLVVISTAFQKLNIAIRKIDALKNFSRDVIEQFEVDEDGAFIYWPTADVHLGWEQLQGIDNPLLVLKARQRMANFNKRFGAAIRTVREAAGLRQTDVPEVSERQLQRIEKGECRATVRAIGTLAKAHRLPVNDYLAKISTVLPKP